MYVDVRVYVGRVGTMNWQSYDDFIKRHRIIFACIFIFILVGSIGYTFTNREKLFTKTVTYNNTKTGWSCVEVYKYYMLNTPKCEIPKEDYTQESYNNGLWLNLTRNP